MKTDSYEAELGPRMRQQVAAALKLLSTPMSAVELSLRMHRTAKVTRGYVCILRKAKKVRVASWRELGKQGDHTPIYGVGSKPDAPKPRKTKKQIWRETLANPDKHEWQKSRKRALWRVAAARKKPQNIFSALGL